MSTDHTLMVTACRGHKFLSCACGQQLGKIMSAEQAASRHEQHVIEARTFELQAMFAAR